MGYVFVEPNITLDDGLPVRTPKAKAAVYVANPLTANVCQSLATTVLRGHESGLSWVSRTRYVPGSTSTWDVNSRFRSSRNISPDLPGLSLAFDAMEREVQNAYDTLGLDPAQVILRRVDDQCLIYFEGDHVGDHADNAASEEDENGNVAWRVIKPRRQVVAVLWLTGQCQGSHDPGEFEFTGGELRFNSLLDEESGEPLVISPVSGKMVAFPASAWFRHEVCSVRAGVRLAVTRWWEAVPLVDSAATPEMVRASPSLV